MISGLTRAQADCLRIIIELIALDGHAPSLADICHEMGFVSKSQAHRVLGRLEDRGYIARLPRRARSILVLKPIPLLLDVEFVLAQ